MLTCAETEVMQNVNSQLAFFLEHEKDFGKTYTQEDIANAIGLVGKSGYQRFRNCLSGRSAFNIDEIISLADLFNVSTDKLIKGYEQKNCIVANQLGLTDEAIQYLQSVKNREGDYQESFITTAEDMSVNADILSVPSDKPIIEGGTSDEILFIVNWLLSHDNGHNLLSIIAKYCIIDTSHCWLYDSFAEDDSSFPFIECEEVFFKNRIGEGLKAVNPAILRYVLIPAITDEVNKIREEIIMEGEKDNGKKKRNHEKASK